MKMCRSFVRSLRPALLGLTFMLLPAPSRAAQWNIHQLMQQLAQVRTDHATFVEKTVVSMLDKPLISSGELFYRAPDYLQKRTLKPKPQSMTVDGNTLIIERDDHTHRVQLQDYPKLAVFIDSIRDTLAGDLAALKRHYRLTLSGSANEWTLTLSPLAKKMQSAVRAIHIKGVQHSIRSIQITQPNGDSSLMKVHKLATQ